MSLPPLARPLPCALVLVAGALFGCAGTKEPSALLRPARTEVQHFEAVGLQLFVADALAAAGSDLVLEAAGGRDDRVQGYIALPEEQRVEFLGIQDGEVRRFYVAEISEDAAAVTTMHGEAADESLGSRFRALRSASASFQPPCDRIYNTVVLPSPDADEWIVYFLAATTHPGEVVLGGHVRAHVSRDGTTVRAFVPLSKSCLVLRKDAAPAGAQVAALYTTHPLGTLPTEIHVYVSLQHELALFVITNDDTRWKVDGGRIEALGK